MEQFDRVCLAFCFVQFHVGRFESRPFGLWYRQQFLSICCLPPSFASVNSTLLAGIYFSFYFKHILLYFFGEMKKKLYLYRANYKFVIRLSSLMRVDLFLNEF